PGAAGDEFQEVGRVRGAVHPALYGIVAAQIALIVEIVERRLEERGVLRLRQKRRLVVARDDDRERERRKRSEQDAVAVRRADALPQVLAKRRHYRPEVLRAEQLLPVDPGRQDRLRQVVAQLWIRRGEIRDQLGRELRRRRVRRRI